MIRLSRWLLPLLLLAACSGGGGGNNDDSAVTTDDDNDVTAISFMAQARAVLRVLSRNAAKWRPCSALMLAGLRMQCPE